MKTSRLGAWIAIAFGSIYFLLPLIATIEFSLRMRRGTYSFDAYASVFPMRSSAKPSAIRC